MNYQWSSVSPIHSSSDNSDNTPSSPTRRRSMSSERHPPHSPVVVAQAQSSVLSPTRGDDARTHPDEGRRTTSPNTSIDDRFNHCMRSVSPSMLTEDSPSSSVQSSTSYPSPGQFAVPNQFERPLPPKFALRMGARERLDCHQQFPTLSNTRLKVEAVGSTQRQQADSSFRPVPIKSEHVQHCRANGQGDVGRSVGLRKLYLTTQGDIRETVSGVEAASTRVEWCNSAGIPDRLPEPLKSDMTQRRMTPKDLCSRELLHRRIKSEQNNDPTFVSPLPMSPPHSQGVTKVESAQYSIIDYSIPRYSSPRYSSSPVDTSPPPSPSEPSSRGDNGGKTRGMVAVQPRYAADSTQQPLCGSHLSHTTTPYGHQTATACISPQYTNKNTTDAVKSKQHCYSVAPSCSGSPGLLESLAQQSSVSLPTSTCPSIASPMSTSSNCSEEQPPTEVASGNLYAVIDKIIIEFDGTTLLCRVCGDRSSGFHYGVHSCEGCKGFFRRSIQQKIQYRQCSKNQQCLVQKTNRNRCQYCRLKKCIEVGMSKDAVRFGRVPKNEKERIRLAMEKASNNSPQQEFNDDFLIQSITSRYIRSSELLAGETIRDIIRRAEESPNVSPISTCPLNPYVGTDDFNQKFSPMVREVVTFAKNIPGFPDIRHDDKITLLRACVFEVLLIRFGALIDSKNRKMVTVSGCIIYASIYSNVKASHDFVNTLFKFIDRINALNLTDEEMALFLAAIVINPKRQGLSELSKITTLHKRIVHCLQLVMQRERPNNPNLYQELVGSLNDLWILNGMHSKQTQGKHRNTSAEESMDGVTSGVQTELGNNQFPVYQDYPEMPTCPISSSYLASSPEYEDKRRTVDETSPTSPTSTFSPDEEMRSPGSADSGCSTDSGCSIESGCSSDSGCSVSSNSMLSSESSCRRHGLHSEDHRESISCPDDETTEKLRKCHIKRKPHTGGDDSSRLDAEKGSLSPWHKPQQEVEKTTDSPVLRKCLESPVTFKMEAFGDFYRSRGAHRHKKFRPALDRTSLLHEVLDSSTSSPHPSTSPSLSYSSSPSPSSSISSSPSRYSSDFGSSLSSPSSYSPSSILAQRLRLPSSKYPETTSLLSQEPKFGSCKEAVRDTLYDCIMSGQSKIPRQPLVAYDISRPSPYPSCHMSSPHSTSPPPSHHSSPHHQFSSSPYLDDAQPLNLSTKTPSPPPVMEA